MFNCNASLLNPKFEGYRLCSDTERISVTKRTLSCPIHTPAELEAPWGQQFQVLADRVYTNHLYSDGMHFYLLCEDGNLYSASKDNISPIYELLIGESFSLVCNQEILICDATHLTFLSHSGSHSSIKVFELNQKYPTVLLDASEEEGFAVAYSIEPPDDGIAGNADFVVSVLKLKEEGPVEVVLQLQGKSRPLFARLLSEKLVIGSESGYRNSNSPCVGNVQEAPFAKSPINWIQNEETVSFSINFPPGKTKASATFTSQGFIVITTDNDDSPTEIVIEGELAHEIVPDDSVCLQDKGQIRLEMMKKAKGLSWTRFLKDEVDSLVTTQPSLPEDEEGLEISSSFSDFKLEVFSIEGRTMESASSVAKFLGLAINPENRRELRIGIQQGVDAAIFKVGTLNSRLCLNHIDTFDAFAYVQSGKPERRFVGFTNDLALIIDSRRHVFIYAKPKGSLMAEQYVVTLEEDEEICGWNVLIDGSVGILTRNHVYTIKIRH